MADRGVKINVNTEPAVYDSKIRLLVEIENKQILHLTCKNI